MPEVVVHFIAMSLENQLLCVLYETILRPDSDFPLQSIHDYLDKRSISTSYQMERQRVCFSFELVEIASVEQYSRI